MVDGKALRLAAGLLAAGFILYVTVGLLHPGGPANDHEAVFAEYAGSAGWTAVHLWQFAAMAVVIAGLLVLSFALNLHTGGAAWMVRFGAVSAAVSLGLYAVLQAVDGVALKQAVDAWTAAPEAQKAARFVGAETTRWLEWGTRSYQCFVFGLALILLGSALAWAAKLPRALGYLMGLSGLAYIVQGWVLGSEGFSPANTFAILGSYVLIMSWITWLALAAWRTRESRGPSREPAG
ncbi:hypothetical protein NCCP1664_14890 [Zafaria cholistanensis]|uniref:DUF4386 family protein n=1 Tax=Zafaria cholistanensis TaxID=1682741 RepID=A0A5A7NQ49_9MICC|nr:hypothetical protein [Zafaria cholistanensis]GER22993.1 hypothetical protein NCCP1664_14890 [Zafaria cholistanensis]